MGDIKDHFFYQIGQSAKDGYFIYDVSWSIFLYNNSSMMDLLEISADLSNYDFNTLFNFIHEEDQSLFESCYQELLDDGGSKKYVLRIIVSEGRVKHVKCWLYLEHNSNQIFGMVEDITVLQENKIHIEQINARKNATLEVLSHDLKEPLAMIKMAISSMEINVSGLTEMELRSSLSFIADVCERNQKLIRGMVNHEFLKSSVVALKKERADLIWELKDVIRFYKRSHLQKIRTFSFSSRDEKIFISLDSMKFLQVINNLISNAIKFTADGGRISVYAEERDETVIISVSDDGIGIPPSMKSKLFQRDKSVLRKGLNGEESSGLGMNIIKDIVDLHQGRIWFVSEVGIGTTFHIELPKI